MHLIDVAWRAYARERGLSVRDGDCYAACVLKRDVGVVNVRGAAPGRERPTLGLPRLAALELLSTATPRRIHTHLYERRQARCRLIASSPRCCAHCKSTPTKKTRPGTLHQPRP